MAPGYPRLHPQNLRAFLLWQRGAGQVSEGSGGGEHLLITRKCDHKRPDEREAEGPDVTTEENIKRQDGGNRDCSEVL